MRQAAQAGSCAEVPSKRCSSLPSLNTILHGKEGVDGSSPSEGLKYLQIGHFCCLI